MHATTLAANPFGLLTDPQSIIEAMERSPRLEGLNRRICRPLDRPAPGKPGEDTPEAAASGVSTAADDTFLVG